MATKTEAATKTADRARRAASDAANPSCAAEAAHTSGRVAQATRTRDTAQTSSEIASQVNGRSRCLIPRLRNGGANLSRIRGAVGRPQVGDNIRCVLPGRG